MHTQVGSTQGGIGEMRFQIAIDSAHNLAPGRIAALEHFVDGGNEVVLSNGLEEHVPSTVFHNSYRRVEAVGFGQDDEVGAYELPPTGAHYLQTAQVRQVHVQNGNVNVLGTDDPERFATEPACPYAPRLRLQPDDFLEACTDPSVAVSDDEPDTPGRMEWRSILVGYN